MIVPAVAILAGLDVPPRDRASTFRRLPTSSVAIGAPLRGVVRS